MLPSSGTSAPMTGPSQASPSTMVRIIHVALTVAPVFVIAALWIAFSGRTIAPALGGVVGYAVYLGCAAVFALGFWWRTRIPSRAGGLPEADYWRATMSKALLLWGTLEAVVMVAAAIAILAGQAAVAGVALMIYLTLMLLSSPGRLAGE